MLVEDTVGSYFRTERSEIVFLYFDLSCLNRPEEIGNPKFEVSVISNYLVSMMGLVVLYAGTVSSLTLSFFGIFFKSSCLFDDS